MKKKTDRRKLRKKDTINMIGLKRAVDKQEGEKFALLGVNVPEGHKQALKDYATAHSIEFAVLVRSIIRGWVEGAIGLGLICR